MEKILGSQGKVREFCQFGKVGTMVKKKVFKRKRCLILYGVNVIIASLHQHLQEEHSPLPDP